MSKMNVENQVFQLPINVTDSGIIDKTLATADTYIDKNIKVTVNTPDAELEVKQGAVVTATVSTTDTTYTSDTETQYPVTIAANAKAAATKVGVKTAGFASLNDEVEVAAADAEQNTKTIYIKEGSLTGSGSTAVSGNVKLTQVDSKPADGFYIDASAAGSVSVNTAGWLPVGAKADTDSESFYTIQKANLSNNESKPNDFTEIDAPILTSGGFLFINEGYIAPTKISLATLVPDNANITEENADKIYNTVSAYDKDGKLIVGTMGDAALGNITASNVEANIGTVTVAAESAGFKVTGSGDISGNTSVAVSKRGLAETSLTQSGTINGTANLDATLAKVGLAIDAPTAMTVKPQIAKETSTAKSGSITSAQPAGRYVAVSTAAIAASRTVTPKVATEGYGTTTVFDATGATVTGGAEASGTFYVPIESGSHTVTADTPAITNASAVVATSVEAPEGFEGDIASGVLAVAPAEGKYITINASATPTKGSVSGTVTCTATEGYIEAGSINKSISGDVNVQVTAAAPKYIRVYDGSML